MGNRLRVLILLVGAAIVVATFTYPTWRPPPEGEVETVELPQLLPELQPAFLELPRSLQTSYRLLSDQNPFQAAALVEARVTAPEPVIDPEPEVANAILSAQGTFGPVFVDITDDRDLPPLVDIELDEDDSRSEPAFSNLHPARGEVLVYRFPDDRVIIRLENLNVVNGPDLWLVLSTTVNPLTSEDFGRDFIEVAPMPGNAGNMNFEIVLPNLGIYESVVIYDRRYGIVFGVAPLE